MYHLRLAGDHYEMGKKRGLIFNKCHITFPLHLDEFQLKQGIESEKILRKYFNEVCLEVEGVTSVIENDYYEFISWLLIMGCCMYNIEKNHPVEIKGCTAFAIKDKINNKIYYARNNDLPPFLKNGSKSEIYKPNNGYKFNITTSSFINGEEGVNEKGLVVAMTFVLTRLEDIKPGFNSVFVVRYLLEKAKDVSEAMNLLQELPVASNMNILLVDKALNMVVIECSPKEKRIRKPVEYSNGYEAICTVNSFTSREMQHYQSYLEDDYKSIDRYNTVMNSIPTLNNQENIIEFCMKLLKGEYGFMCQYDKSLCFETIWSTIIDLQTLDIYRAEGNPLKVKFINDGRMKIQ